MSTAHRYPHTYPHTLSVRQILQLDRPGPDAAAVLESCRTQGLLIGKGGGHDTSVLRIAPPMTLTVAEAEEGAAILERALRGAEFSPSGV